MPSPTIAFVGLGYIGLPTAVVLANHGNQVVGIDIDYETVGKDGSMLMVSVSGTAVKTRR